ncbi:MAG: hypothetical protein M5U12_17215 [Verrucomicrobia bacterium]|nr:hypothetical protein [Verrucomicrobiota bacterium]
MSSKLQAITDQAALTLKALVREGEKDILKAWAACLEEAEVQEQNPKLRLTFTITLDLGKDQAAHELTFGIRHRLSNVTPIPDPTRRSSPEGATEKTTVTIKTPQGSATAPWAS